MTCVLALDQQPERLRDQGPSTTHTCAGLEGPHSFRRQLVFPVGMSRLLNSILIAQDNSVT